MQTTPNYGFKKPEYNETVDIADLNYNADQMDSALTPTADPTLVYPDPMSNGPHKLEKWVSWLVNLIKSITGKANWWDAPVATIEALNSAVGTKAEAGDLGAHLAETVTQDGGIHGLEIDSGTWTPVLIGATTPGTNTYSKQSGSYYKVGKLVTVNFDIILSAKDAAMAGGLQISGLPFACSSSEYSPAFGRVEGITLDAAYTHLSGYTAGSLIALAQVKNTWGNILPASISNTALFRGSLTYVTS